MTTIAANFDVVVIGGGPAGAATALSLRRTRPELSVAIVDAGDFRAVRIGETLPPLAAPLLRQLGLLETLEEDGHLSVFSTSAAWGHSLPLPNEYFSQPHSRGWHLDRNQFDQRLLSEAQVAGAVWVQGKLRKAYSRNHHWSLELQNSVHAYIQTKFVVDASGRRAILARQCGIKPQLQDRLVGVARFFSLNQSAQLNSASTLIESCAQGWWYSAVLPGQKLVVAAMTDADIARELQLHKIAHWQAWLNNTRYIRQRLVDLADSSIEVTDPLVRSAATQVLPQCTGKNWLAVGDAASCVDPVSSQGIARALRFGIYAAYAICDWFANKKPGLAQYQSLVQTEFQDYLTHRCEVYRDEQRWAQQSFWVRRH